MHILNSSSRCGGTMLLEARGENPWLFIVLSLIVFYFIKMYFSGLETKVNNMFEV